MKKNTKSFLLLCWWPVIHNSLSPVDTQILFIIFRNMYMLWMPGCSSPKLVLCDGHGVQCSPCLLTFQRPPTSTQSDFLENCTGHGPVLSNYSGASQGSRLGSVRCSGVQGKRLLFTSSRLCPSWENRGAVHVCPWSTGQSLGMWPRVAKNQDGKHSLHSQQV